MLAMQGTCPVGFFFVYAMEAVTGTYTFHNLHASRCRLMSLTASILACKVE